MYVCVSTHIYVYIYVYIQYSFIVASLSCAACVLVSRACSLPPLSDTVYTWGQAFPLCLSVSVSLLVSLLTAPPTKDRMLVTLPLTSHICLCIGGGVRVGSVCICSLFVSSRAFLPFVTTRSVSALCSPRSAVSAVSAVSAEDSCSRLVLVPSVCDF